RGGHMAAPGPGPRSAQRRYAQFVVAQHRGQLRNGCQLTSSAVSETFRASPTARARYPRSSVSGRRHAGALDHQDHRPHRCARAVDDATRDRVAEVPAERHARLVLDIDHELAVEDDEALILMVVLVPMVFALDDAEPHYAVVLLGSSAPRLLGSLDRAHL